MVSANIFFLIIQLKCKRREERGVGGHEYAVEISWHEMKEIEEREDVKNYDAMYEWKKERGGKE